MTTETVIGLAIVIAGIYGFVRLARSKNVSDKIPTRSTTGGSSDVTSTKA